jgi:hypothetical protein
VLSTSVCNSFLPPIKAVDSCTEQTAHAFNSIHHFDCEYFSSIERQGPGSPEQTRRALSFISDLTNESKIADIGCGTDGQAILLAEHTLVHITDLYRKENQIAIRSSA